MCCSVAKSDTTERLNNKYPKYCVCACVCVCMCVCARVHMGGWVHMCGGRVCACVCACACRVHVCTRVHGCVCVCACVWAHVHVCVHVCVHAKLLQQCPTLFDLMDYSPSSLPESSVHGTLQARIMEWFTMPSSRGPSQSRDRTRLSHFSCVGRWVLCY